MRFTIKVGRESTAVDRIESDGRLLTELCLLATCFSIAWPFPTPPSYDLRNMHSWLFST